MIENVFTVTEKLYIRWIFDKMKSDVRLIAIRMIFMLFLVMNIFSWMAVSVSLCVVTAGICIYCLFLHWIVAGHLNYRRLSRRNYGADWTRRTCFEEEIIRIIDGRTSIYFRYGEIVGIREKENEIRLIFSNGMNVWIYQNCFVNSGWEACKEHIRQARRREGVPEECVFTARARRQEDKQGRVLRIILAVLVVMIICLEMVNWMQGRKTGDNRGIAAGGSTVTNVELFVRQSLERLKVLGIEVPDEEQAVNSVMGMPEDMLADMEERLVVGLLLDGIGTNSTMYCFDTEIFDISVMYTDFLNAVAALSGGDLEITNIQEDISGIDEESGRVCTGSVFNATEPHTNMRVRHIMTGLT